ncbi:MAG: 3-oxoacyl-ACP reductase FabG [Arenicellales bacterium]|jgi:acetoacetyl-CoA reductase/3-oxoacyl-[acyl-carrier protein] reductase|nr:3-oxoacyl-ACP reductase FabG [Arenicellales bacterium]|tara:strand:+ start:1168 stop:1887 length:720 start_codon:yes stop_codon:yes gene_type:complete
MSDLLDLRGRTAVVTGAGRGIGQEIAVLLRRHGCSVHVFDLDPGSEPIDSDYVFHQVDVRDPTSIEQAVAALPADTSLLVNNAGITRDRTLAKMSDSEWHEVLAVNLTGAFNVIRAITPLMREAGHGRIVNVTSINGLRGKFGQTNYSAAKAGLVGLTKAAARELGPRNITVNAVAPGMVLTPMSRELPPEIIERSRAEAVLNDLAKPADVAYAVLFLLSDAARMITGEVLRVDGGQYI